MKTMHVAASMVALALACGGVAKAETVTATFTQADGGDTVGSYWGDVDVTVTGYGQSSGADFNDAFYIFQNNGENTCKTYLARPRRSAFTGWRLARRRSRPTIRPIWPRIFSWARSRPTIQATSIRSSSTQG
jgi:hypothetical protein